MNRIIILACCVMTMGMSSCVLDKCYTKDSFLNHLENTVDKSVEDSKEWTEEDWKKKDEELEKLMDECYEKFKEELTREERRKVFKESTRYVYHRQKDKFKEFFTVIEDMNLEEEARRLVTMADEEIKTIFNDVLDEDFESLIDDAVNEFEKLAKDLKQAWQEAKEDSR